MRTTARTTRAVLAAASVAALSLSLTACDGGSGSDTDATGVSASGDKTAPRSGGADSAAPAAGGDCTLATSKTEIEDTGGTAPVVLLKITNNGARTCAVRGAPLVGDPTTGRNLPVAENTRPRSVVRLGPGRSAYAAIDLASIDADRTHRAKTLGITLATKDGKATQGRVTVASPGAAGLLLDAGSQVTYWQNTLEDAMR
ncbi:DUF4232 domain-containing protein [Streptomyces sp. NPDC050147]|uniref:DUF4232 domain-containing protein n=1 Tax=Streptomyces sp. NPDC050147 TaxID=3155513 RepID=UPI0034483A3B